METKLPDGSTETREYDKNSNMTKRTDPAGNVIDNVFDTLNRNTSRQITLVSGFSGSVSETRVFDALDRLVSNADDDYKIEYEYAVIGLTSFVYSETQSYVGQSAQAKTVTRSRNALGQKTVSPAL